MDPHAMNLVLMNMFWVLSLMTLVWLVSLPLRDVSIVDPFWSVAFLCVGTHTLLHTPAQARDFLLYGMLVVWSVRLCVYLLARKIGTPEDPRYTAFRKRFGEKRYPWFSFFQVFMLQGFLALVISAPFMIGGLKPVEHVFSWYHVLGFVVFAAGFVCETLADFQLSVFKKNPHNQGKVLNTGVWKYSRHPNYFGESLVWWGFWITSLGITPWAWATVFSPVLMTFLLLRVSGVTLLDAHMLKHKPLYADYIQTTPAFFPKIRF